MSNKNLTKAKKACNDEFFTMYVDVENELQHYTDQLKGKTIYCNCDTIDSNFVKYFMDNKSKLGIRKLLHSSVDFRSEESIGKLRASDIVITNPPFSLFREYIAQLIEYDKKFLVIGSQNAITYKETFPLLKDNKIWLGHNNNQSFVFKSPYENTLIDNVKFCESKGYVGKNYIKVPAINWYTNLDTTKRHEKLILYKTYDPIEYPTYDNYDAINIDKVVDIPCDYCGNMGLPITFLDKYNPDQFEIVGITDRQNTSGLRTKKYTIDDSTMYNDLNARSVIKLNGKLKAIYARILIKRRNIDEDS